MKSIEKIESLIEEIESELYEIECKNDSEYDITENAYYQLSKLREAIDNLYHDIEGDTDLVL